MRYFTNYAFFKGKEVTFQSTNIACFAGWIISNREIKKDEILKVFFPIKYFGDNKYTGAPEFNKYRKYIEYFISKLNKIGYKIDIGYGNCKFYDQKKYNPIDFIERGIIFKLDCNNYRSKAELKIILYIIRYIWEYYQPDAIITFRKIYPLNKDFIYSFNKAIREIKRTQGHTMQFPDNITTRDFKKYMDSLANKPHKGDEVENLYNIIPEEIKK